MIEKVVPYVASFAGALVLTLVLTPLVRLLCKRMGMVDQPDPRRINKVPVPRGGGLSIVVGLFVSYFVFILVTQRPAMQSIEDAVFLKMSALSVLIAVLGLLDDKFSLPPKVKLVGQLAVAALVWSWAGIGFAKLWPDIPGWLDCLITVFWIAGAVNAFNLIDGLDGLATGIALIATVGMAGGLFFALNPQQTLFYFAFAGALVGFLRYNYNPASIFLGDCGSMFIGFMLSTLPLMSQESNSFLVSVGMPILAMGVPIFDTALAILRRLIRKLFNRQTGKGGGVMSADKDHVHHRIFRAVGLNQRRAAWTLYALTAFLVAVGLGGMYLESRAGGLWLLALSIACVVAFRDLARIELFEAGRLLDVVAHAEDAVSRRRIERLGTVLYLVFDALAVIAAFFACMKLLNCEMDVKTLRVTLPVRVFCVFASLVFFRTYVTVWARAMVSDYLRLTLACVFGAVFGAVALYYSPVGATLSLFSFSLLFAFLCFVALLTVRFVRPVARDVFFEISRMRNVSSREVSRILVYGSGLRYRAFRRELVRSMGSGSRVVVGLLDDNMLLHGKYIGGVKVLGGIRQAPELVRKMNVDAIVVACEISESKMKIVKELLASEKVRISVFGFLETPV